MTSPAWGPGTPWPKPGTEAVWGKSNPSAHPWLHGGNPWSQELQRGVMWTAEDAAQGHQPNIFYFLFNPNELDVDYGSIDDSNLLPQDQVQTFKPIGNYTHQTLSFSLFLDRTYDQFSAVSPPGTQFSHQSGVMVDVAAFQNLVGIIDFNAGPMLPTPIKMQMGYWFRFYGMVASAQVTYTHFAANLAPYRAVINVTMAQLWDTSYGTGTSNSGDPSQSGAPAPATNQPGTSASLPGITSPAPSDNGQPYFSGRY